MATIVKNNKGTNKFTPTQKNFASKHNSKAKPSYTKTGVRRLDDNKKDVKREFKKNTGKPKEIKPVARKKYNPNIEKDKLVMTYNRFKRYNPLFYTFKIIHVHNKTKEETDIFKKTIYTLSKVCSENGEPEFYLNGVFTNTKYLVVGGHYHKDKNVMFKVKIDDTYYEFHAVVFIKYKERATCNNPTVTKNNQHKKPTKQIEQ